MARELQIGELARQSGCPAETIRFYEREGLLPAPERTPGNYRLYSAAHVTRLAFIRNCRILDMTLDEIRELLNVRDLARENCGAAHRLLDDHMQHVANRIEELQELQKQLKSLRRTCVLKGRKHSHCAILDDLARVPLRARSSQPAHVRGSHPNARHRVPGKRL